MEKPTRIILGVSGASGAVYARRALEALKDAGVETHLVISRAAEITLAYELGERGRDLAAHATVSYGVNDVGAAIASGSRVWMCRCSGASWLVSATASLASRARMKAP